ncbi:hypothetical protein CYMTET_24917 [Cymbomonas tetramitiformis]|uniref:Uncharacterized protein n=1 Tax=Cymbomonas tetramitiformis TaxID=36881 RepID=A0AAE0FVM4_9CHLO|nr:hypothetical protein CYMTET_24917 [Cymbomonas tetramitiformis]
MSTRYHSPEPLIDGAPIHASMGAGASKEGSAATATTYNQVHSALVPEKVPNVIVDDRAAVHANEETLKAHVETLKKENTLLRSAQSEYVELQEYCTALNLDNASLTENLKKAREELEACEAGRARAKEELLENKNLLVQAETKLEHYTQYVRNKQLIDHTEFDAQMTGLLADLSQPEASPAQVKKVEAKSTEDSDKSLGNPWRIDNEGSTPIGEKAELAEGESMEDEEHRPMSHRRSERGQAYQDLQMDYESIRQQLETFYTENELK